MSILTNISWVGISLEITSSCSKWFENFILIQAFFQEERQSLDKKRHVLRLLQQRKITDINTLKDFPLPDQIPMQLVIGTKVNIYD